MAVHDFDSFTVGVDYGFASAFRVIPASPSGFLSRFDLYIEFVEIDYNFRVFDRFSDVYDA